MYVECEKCQGACRRIGRPVLVEKDSNLLNKFFRLFFIGMSGTNGDRVDKMKKDYVWVCNRCGHTFPDDTGQSEDNAAK